MMTDSRIFEAFSVPGQDLCHSNFSGEPFDMKNLRKSKEGRRVHECHARDTYSLPRIVFLEFQEIRYM